MTRQTPDISPYVAIDVDGTLTRSNLSFLFGNFLYRQKKISLMQALRATLLYLLHRVGILSVERLHRSIFSFLFKGKMKSVYEEAADQFFADAEWAFRHNVIAEILQLRSQGARLVLLSSSPDFLVCRMARRLKITEWYGTQYCCSQEGVFSCIGHIMTGKEKAKIVQHDTAGEVRIITFSDSLLDTPLFEISDSVVIVAPSKKLASSARKRGWRVIAGE
jgi:HAD superfamily phosphoserine phosphatase-like hydrolase